MSNVESAEGLSFILVGGKGWVNAEWAGNMQEAIQRVRKLVEQYEKFGNDLDPRYAPAEVFQGVAKQINEALDGEHEQE